ncbi:NAD(P)/FAD-dependent oxidoreductase [Pelagicoccus sp. NFK12]|uniref:NAD(P)/FAD-dependent oxidoreductase n=1 Tax=Pelagicoccus enzymogenes TaxID=2773457 RepID=A0A927IHC0_9BACT|nr:FAD-dependent oxidoreductase [Pelagicoccus enzymogenes]MBD5779563.1 NAD(P)/FAD-dependent oxidoreductase [Pelagicoccus enzymogenes]
MSEHYDVAIIGAGMSGLSAGIRAAHFGKKAIILEQHNAPGGLNSFYAKEGRKYDVGLHAMTNFVPAKERRAIFNKLLRQLRIDRSELDLIEQKSSRIAFPGANLRFGNDEALLESEVERVFPGQVDGFIRLSVAVRNYPDAAISQPYQSTRKWIKQFISDPLLEEMLFCPLMYYGSAVEDDMDVGQFVVMFRSIFHEGLARPAEGIRLLIRVVLDRYRKLGGIRKMKTGVKQLIAEGGKISRIVLENGSELTADVVLSCAGLPETYALVDKALVPDQSKLAGQLSFSETIAVYETLPETWGWGDDTIVFFNNAETFSYRNPADPIDLRSGVICLPNNFEYGDRPLGEGLVRVTCLANHDTWCGYSDEQYVAAKGDWFGRIQQSILPMMPVATRQYAEDLVATDMFTPRTVKKFTRRARGAIYGSPGKVKDGRTEWGNLFLCGTDQGYLGIVGSMLSGVVMANEHVLKG